MMDDYITHLKTAVADLNKLGYTSLVDAIVKQDQQIKRLEGLLTEAYKEVRRVEDTIEKLEETVRKVDSRVYRLEPCYED